MSWREDIRRGLFGLVKSAADSVSQFAEGAEPNTEPQSTRTEQTQTKKPVEKVEPVSGKTEKTKKKSKAAKKPKKPKKKASPPGDPGDLYPGTAAHDTTLLEQLSDMTIQMNEMVRRLEDDGLGDEARSVVGGASTVREGETIDLDNLGALTLASRRAAEATKTALRLFREAMAASKEKQEELLERAERAADAADQAADGVQEMADELQNKADRLEAELEIPPEVLEATKYDWNRKPIYIGFTDPASAFKQMDTEWSKIAFGVKRDSKGDPMGFSQYSPFAVARGSSLDQGIPVPYHALVNKTAFVNWAASEDLQDGISLEIRSVMSKPGQKIIR